MSNKYTETNFPSGSHEVPEGIGECMRKAGLTENDFPLSETFVNACEDAAANTSEILTHTPSYEIPKPASRILQDVLPSSSEGGATFHMDGKTYTMTQDVSDALVSASEKTGFPLQVLQSVAARESSLKADSVNARSQACGLFQFMTGRPWTLYEVVAKYGPENGYEDAAKLVEREVWKRNANGDPYYRYAPTDPQAEQALKEMCLSPEFNATLYAAYTMPKIEPYIAWLGRDITSGEFALINNYGEAGAKLFQKQVWDDKKHGVDTLAKDFFAEHKHIFGDVSANKTTLYHENGSPKTMRESYAGIMKFGGYEEVEITKPNTDVAMTTTQP